MKENKDTENEQYSETYTYVQPAWPPTSDASKNSNPQASTEVEQGKTPSFPKTELVKFFQTTSIKGVPRIINANVKYIRILWLVAVIVFLSLAIFQAYGLIYKYLEYITVIRSQRYHYSEREEQGADRPTSYPQSPPVTCSLAGEKMVMSLVSLLRMEFQVMVPGTYAIPIHSMPWMITAGVQDVRLQMLRS